MPGPTMTSVKNNLLLTLLLTGLISLGFVPRAEAQVKLADAQKFVDWVVSAPGQAAIAGYKIGGEQLFFPNATK